MWPIQEVTLPLPGRVSLLCGDSSIPFEYVRAGWQVLPKIGLLASSVNLDQSVALQFYLADALALKRNSSSTIDIRRRGQPLITDLSQLSLPSIMPAKRFKACSLAKDKFFALYGVFKELEVPHKVDVSRYTEMTEVEVFLAVFESCVACDSSLDVLRLAQSPEGYVRHDDFWPKRQDPYDSFANALFGTAAKISPILFRGSLTMLRSGESACHHGYQTGRNGRTVIWTIEILRLFDPTLLEPCGVYLCGVQPIALS